MAKNENEIKFHLIKTSSYRTYYFDGVFGGLTPKGKIYAELFVERQPTPTEMVHDIKSDLTLGDERREQRESKDGIIREIECGIMMDLKTAIAFKEWLEDKIREHQKIQENLKQDTK